MDICVTETTVKGAGATSKDDDSADEALVFQIMTMWLHLGFLFILIILLVTTLTLKNIYIIKIPSQFWAHWF